MSAFALKLLALITMIIDHVGAVFFPEYIWLRYIGRIAMPIYTFLLVQGYRYTKNFTRYVLRLCVFAVLSEVPYDLLFRRKWLEFGNQNVMFTLLLSLLVMRFLDLSAQKRNVFWLLCAAGFAALAYVFRVDYGIYGVLMVLSFYLFRDRRGVDALVFSGLTYGRCLLKNNTVQLWAVMASVPVFLYNGKKGALSLKYFFYFAYPVHLLVLFAVRYVLETAL